jgi:hypothetical protein
VRDKKRLEQLATHDVQDIFELFSLVDKCARATEGCDWHSQPTPEAGKVSKSKVDIDAQGNDKKKKKKKVGGKDKPLARGPTAADATAGGGRGPRGDKCPRQLSIGDDGGQWFLVYNSKRHSVEESRKIKKLAKQVCEQQKR